MDLEKKIRDKTAVLIVMAFILYIVFNYGNNVTGILNYVYKLLFPFILGGCIAFILNIPVTFLSKQLSKCKEKGIGKLIRKCNRGISIVASCIFIVGIITLISYIIIPNIIETIKILPNAFNSSSKAFEKWLDSNTWLANNAMNLINNIGIDWNKIFNGIKSGVLKGASSVVLSTLGAATTFASATVEFILAFIFSIYILAQKEKLGTQFKKILYAFMKKEKVDSMIDILKLTSKTFSSFITGQFTVAAILGFLFFVVMSIFNLPYAMVISILIGCFSIIPVLGSVIGFALGMLFILMANPAKVIVFVIIYAVIKQLEDNFIYPKIVGDSVGLPSIWVLAAITLGDKVLGVIGMLIFVPLFSVVYVLLRKEVYMRLNKKHLEVE
ncbi:AI-2E family transporter [Clostridium sp. CT7]|uniref:AI-2E family transporter n=2 Tax=Clostridium TaxID=1485 RepID=UPI0008271F2B|nr:AI-2E family transporter [Clostridium sp. CT7]PJI07270.1 AI-2E family transporter [Clostridium sp. CT7]